MKNLILDRQLIDQARCLGGHETKKEAVSAAKYVKRCKQLGIIPLFGTVDFDPKYNSKFERRRERS